MTKVEHVFDPHCSQLFLQQYQKNKAAGNLADLNVTDLFYQLNQSHISSTCVFNAFDFLKGSFTSSKQFIADNDLENLTEFNFSALPDKQFSDENVNECIRQASVIYLLQPCWLENIAQAFSSQSEIACHLLSIYSLSGKSGENDLLVSYKSMLLSLGFKIPVFHSSDFCQRGNILDEFTTFATIQLSLAQFPRVFFAEILGFTLACLQLPTLIELCFPENKVSTRYFNRRKTNHAKQLNDLTAIIQQYLDLFPQHNKQLTMRIADGFGSYQYQMQCCRDALYKMWDKHSSPEQLMLGVLKNKAIAAIGHHKNIALLGMPLDDWFKGMPENNQAFLHALKNSSYVDIDNPQESQLLKLFEFEGPMFGVINQTERDVLVNWIKSASEPANSEVAQAASASIKQPIEHKTQSLDSGTEFNKLKNRQLYYYLINKDLFPDVLSKAHWRVRTVLRLCSLFNPPPFKEYSYAKFDSYIADIYQSEILAYQPLKGKPKISKEAYKWGIEQVAPMILIDGCWLQNSKDLKNSYPEISEILHTIYLDELGNGNLQQNHPCIFQALLDSLEINVPDVQSRDFIEHSRFISTAFDLPVFMLSLSCFSVEFLPELLGLNMAIELSGLGKSYMNLVDEWTYWDIKPTIANIHISIDNYESGHTFMAKKAIQLYMDDISKRTGDSKQLNKHWKRIYTGYASLRFVGKRFKLALPVQYLNYKFSNRDAQSVA